MIIWHGVNFQATFVTSVTMMMPGLPETLPGPHLSILLHPSHCQTRFSVLSFWQLIKTQGLRYISPLFRLPAWKWPQLLSLYEACCFPCFSTRSNSPSQATDISLICSLLIMSLESSHGKTKIWGYLFLLESPWAQEMQTTTASRLSKTLTAM